ncbi:cell surface glycoprotein 1-like [Leguminivora glycinivorella]|uniref:cell surface glycoprotein 1-like n=1 Tax=Leguminivora glycinivorella TaxID=1035111 RepID=UPI00200CD6DC|nr:cell surface glycoprotein 1-like [Leguminivora glycinivorella]
MNSSVDMNSSPLNPDAPVFVPGTVAGADILLAESPRKPQPMDDIELPDVKQFETEVVRRPAELLDLDNCDQLNGHHNVSIDGITEQLNGNDKNTLDSLGFGFSVGVEPDKAKDISLIQDFDRIQKDTTDFCNIQVFQAHSETNPFASDDNEELLERLKSKERDPMSMSFYQEKDDDTCERLLDGPVDLNAVQPLPAADDADDHDDKENRSPAPDNDRVRAHHDPFDQPNFIDYVNNSNNLQNFPDIDLQTDRPPQDNLMQTDTPESHKLLFEQIPEIPDGKSSELGFNEDIQDPSDRAITPQEETSQDVEMECKPETPCEPASRPESAQEPPQTQNEIVESEHAVFEEFSHRAEHADNLIENDTHATENHEHSNQHAAPSPAPADRGDVTPEPAHELQENVKAEIHNCDRIDDHYGADAHEDEPRDAHTPHDLREDVDLLSAAAPESETTASPFPAPAHSPLPAHSPAPVDADLLAALPAELARSPLPAEVPLPSEQSLSAESPLPLSGESALPVESEIPRDFASPVETEPPSASPALEVVAPAESPLPVEPELRPETASPIAAAPSPAPPVCDRLTPEVPREDAAAPLEDRSRTPEAASGPAPDIVPEQAHRDLVTDIDIGIPESHAQEICVPVTSEIVDEAVRLSAGTPPPTPAVDPAASPLDAPAADVPVAAVAAAAAGAAAVAAVAATAVAKAKTPAKKTAASPAPKTTATPKSAAKPPRPPPPARSPPERPPRAPPPPGPRSPSPPPRPRPRPSPGPPPRPRPPSRRRAPPPRARSRPPPPSPPRPAPPPRRAAPKTTAARAAPHRRRRHRPGGPRGAQARRERGAAPGRAPRAPPGPGAGGGQAQGGEGGGEEAAHERRGEGARPDQAAAPRRPRPRPPRAAPGAPPRHGARAGPYQARRSEASRARSAERARAAGQAEQGPRQQAHHRQGRAAQDCPRQDGSCKQDNSSKERAQEAADEGHERARERVRRGRGRGRGRRRRRRAQAAALAARRRQRAAARRHRVSVAPRRTGHATTLAPPRTSLSRPSPSSRRHSVAPTRPPRSEDASEAWPLGSLGPPAVAGASISERPSDRFLLFPLEFCDFL